MLKTVKTKLKEDTAGKIDELADESHIDTSTLLSQLIEHGLKIKLLMRSTQLYAEGKVLMWKAAQMAGISFYEMMAEIKKHECLFSMEWKILNRILKHLRNLRVISNTSPLIYLSKIGRLDLLHHMFDTVYVPSAVVTEILREKELTYESGIL